MSSGLEGSPRTSVAKRGSTSTSSGLTISGSAELWTVGAIPDLYPSNEGRSHDERLATRSASFPKADGSCGFLPARAESPVLAGAFSWSPGPSPQQAGGAWHLSYVPCSARPWGSRSSGAGGSRSRGYRVASSTRSRSGWRRLTRRGCCHRKAKPMRCRVWLWRPSLRPLPRGGLGGWVGRTRHLRNGAPCPTHAPNVRKWPDVAMRVRGGGPPANPHGC